MKFNWQASDNSGKKVTGQKEAPDRFALARELRAEGLNLISAKPVRSWLDISFLNRLGIKDRIVFAGNLSSMLKAGLPLSRALGVISRQAGSPAMKQIALKLEKRVNAGESFSKSLDSLGGVFPPVFVAMVAASEESGRLPEALKTINRQLKKTYDLRRKIRSALVYPAIIIIAIVVIAVLMLVFLVPVLSETFAELGAELPLSTRTVIYISQFLENNGLLLAVVLLLLIIAFFVFIKIEKGKRIFDKAVLYIPFFGGLLRKANVAIFAGTLSSLLSAGVGLTESLRITSKVVGNSQFGDLLLGASGRVQKGTLLSDIFNERNDLVFPLTSELTAVGEESGELPAMLLETSIFYEEDIDEVTKNISTILEPALIVVVGLAVGFFAIAVLSPLYSLAEIF